jgi:thiosulfate/3-mercaptopyruvate sulfurtransferase
MSVALHDTLIEPAELAACLTDPDLAVVDCRHDLLRPDWGAQAYAESHIAGALFAHLDRDLSGPTTPQTGRHPLPDIERFAETLSQWGIDDRVQVVAYDQGNGALAARLWWMLRWIGHTRVAVLNGGLAAWQAAGLPLTKEPGRRERRQFVPNPDRSAVLTTEDVVRQLGQRSITLIDARAADRFAGENETIDPVAGHVPGARNHPFSRNLDAQGRFLAPEELRKRWQQTLQNSSPANAVSMCGSGVTACHNLLALQIAGLPEARLYAGSWSEWIRDPNRPIER